MGFFKKFLEMGSIKKTEEVLCARYNRLDPSLPETERLYLVLAERGGWNRLPEPFLRELAVRLARAASSEGGGPHYVAKLAQFVWISERGRLESTRYPALASLHSETGWRQGQTDCLLSRRDPALSLVATALSSLGSSLLQAGEAQNAARAFLSALDVDRDNASALCSLGVLYHAVGEHQRALPLLERGISVLEESGPWWQQFADAIGDADLRTRFENEIHRPEETRELLATFREVLADCRSALEAHGRRTESEA